MNYIHIIVLLFLLTPLVKVSAEDFKEQLLRVGVEKADIEKLVNQGYSDMASLNSLSLGTLMQLGISGKNASRIRMLTDAKDISMVGQIIEQRSKELGNTELPSGWKAAEKSVRDIQAMQKDIYEKTSEFQTRRQLEIDKLVRQIQTASQEGDVSYQIGTATIKNYDADAENLKFSIVLIESLKQFIKVKNTELAESTVNMSPQEARNFPLGKNFPVFARSVSWNDDSLYVNDISLDNSNLKKQRLQAEKERQQKLEADKQEQQRRGTEEKAQVAARQQAVANEQSQLTHLLTKKQQEEELLKELAQKKADMERELGELRKEHQEEQDFSSYNQQTLPSENIVKFAQLRKEQVNTKILPPHWCINAKTTVELLICHSNDVELWHLDNLMGVLYLQNGKPKDQKYWLVAVRNKCKDVFCLKQVYRDRVAILNND